MKTLKMINKISLLGAACIVAGFSSLSLAKSPELKNPCFQYSLACKNAGMTVTAKDGNTIANQYCIQQILGKGNPTKVNPKPEPVEIVINFVKTGVFVTPPQVDDSTTAQCAARLKIGDAQKKTKSVKFKTKDAQAVGATDSPCTPYRQVCEAAGFELPPNGSLGGAALNAGKGAGQTAKGNRLIKDCLQVLLEGKSAKSLNGTTVNPPAVDENTKKQCQAQIETGSKSDLFKTRIVLDNPDKLKKQLEKK